MPPKGALKRPSSVDGGAAKKKVDKGTSKTEDASEKTTDAAAKRTVDATKTADVKEKPKAEGEDIRDDAFSKLQETLGSLRSGLDGSYASSLAALESAARDLMNNWDLWIAGNRFRISEVEAYVHSPAHADPYAHGDEGQSTCGVWYFHRKGGTYKNGTFKGMDLACGDKDHDVFAGLLLRSIADSVDKLVEGPCMVVDKFLELNGKKSIAEFAAGRSAAELSAVATEGLRLTPAAVPRTRPVHTAARVGLVLRSEDAGPKTHMQGRPVEFCTRPYRFSTDATRLLKYRCGFVAAAHLAGTLAGETFRLSASFLSKYLQATDEGKAKGDPSKWLDKKISAQPELCEFIGACHKTLASLP